MNWRVAVSLLALVGLLCAGGCAPDDDRPPTYPVSGTISFQGKPVEGADIVFVPNSPGAVAAFAKSTATGEFKMRTFAPGDGVVSGSYKIKVTRFESPQVTAGEVFADAEAEAAVYQPVEGGPVKVPRNLLPKKYADHNSSGLTHTVNQQPTTFDIAIP